MVTSKKYGPISADEIISRSVRCKNEWDTAHIRTSPHAFGNLVSNPNGTNRLFACIDKRIWDADALGKQIRFIELRSSGRTGTFDIELSAPGGIYALIHSGEIVYIGYSVEIMSRIACHASTGSGKEFDSVWFLSGLNTTRSWGNPTHGLHPNGDPAVELNNRCHTKKAWTSLENLMIERFDPIYNRTGSRRNVPAPFKALVPTRG